jgi:hypothetical protein
MASKSFWIGVLAAALAASPASAAEGKAQLISSNGKVLVNQGDGFVQPSTGMLLNTGSRIFVGHEASAEITYVADNCQVVVPADRVVTIEVLSPCQNKTVQIHPAADIDLPPEAVAAEPNLLPLVAILGAGAIIGGLCIADVICDDDDKDRHPR